MFELKYHTKSLLNPLGMNIPKPFLITGAHTFFQRAPVSQSVHKGKNKD